MNSLKATKLQVRDESRSKQIKRDPKTDPSHPLRLSWLNPVGPVAVGPCSPMVKDTYNDSYVDTQNDVENSTAPS